MFIDIFCTLIGHLYPLLADLLPSSENLNSTPWEGGVGKGKKEWGKEARGKETRGREARGKGPNFPLCIRSGWNKDRGKGEGG